MSLAARFPMKLDNTIERCHEGGASSVSHEPIVYLVDSEETVSDKPVCNQSSMTVHDPGCNEKETLNYDETSRSSGDVVLDSSGGALERCYYSKDKKSIIEIEGTGTVFCDGEKRTINDEFSSPDSVLLSQNSLDSATAQTAERIGSCSESNSEGEDLTNGNQLKSLKHPTSFVELLQMAGSSMPQKGYRHGNNIYADSNSTDKCIQSQAVDYEEWH
ncbi:uncharacterized protein LOC110822889 [Carica papaya]|uniref:uncharacterized protein LOC110822889 n=1 Tax=Carica papaya TaxID=3649 RepID=UPI000B8CD981|nr:uncharacterized protein LOC110822889 [Carica papaya]